MKIRAAENFVHEYVWNAGWDIFNREIEEVTKMAKIFLRYLIVDKKLFDVVNEEFIIGLVKKLITAYVYVDNAKRENNDFK